MSRLLNRKLLSAVLAMTVAFVLVLSIMYNAMIRSAKSKYLDIYSTSFKTQYSAFNDEIGVLDRFLRGLKSNEDFLNITEHGNPNVSQSALNVYSSLVSAANQNKYVTDTYLIFKDSNSAISGKSVVYENSSGPDLSCDGYNYSFLRDKVFTASGDAALFYSNRVYYEGKKDAALLYCKAIDGTKFSNSKSAGVTIIPVSRINNALKLSEVFGDKAVFAVYSKADRAYETKKINNIKNYSVIDCDDNEDFSWCVYIQNDFFADIEGYYYKMIWLFAAYFLICLAYAWYMIKNEEKRLAESSGRRLCGLTEKFSINSHISGLFMHRATKEDSQWFRDNVPDFPRPCIIALFKTDGADSELILNTMAELGNKPCYVYPDPNCHFAAFFNYSPDGKCMAEIKESLEKFTDRLLNSGIKTVISLSNPCMDIDEIYDSYMTADLMFKYNEYKNLICAGDVTENSGFLINAEENGKILKFIIAENAFEANRIIYGQWYELSQNPSFGDDIERLFLSQIGILAGAAVKVEYDRELPKYNPKLSVTELAFVVTDAVNDMVAFIGTRQSNSTLYNDVIGYIDENFTNPDFSQPDVKEKFGISTKTITKILKQKKNMLFSEYLEYLRIDKARYILAHSDIKIYDISKMCGYGTNDAFYKAFNKKEGMTPGAYRKENSEKNKK